MKIRGPDESQMEVDPVDVVEANEPWAIYKLADGTELRVRFVLQFIELKTDILKMVTQSTLRDRKISWSPLSQRSLRKEGDMLVKEANVGFNTANSGSKTCDQSLWVLRVGPLTVIPGSDSNVPREQMWFWTREWQAGEQEASRELEEGRGMGPFESVMEMKAHFEAWKRAQKSV
jgi:hypothetical protein